jgi:dimethylaniline monooxygenase (N-oxide forming)
LCLGKFSGVPNIPSFLPTEGPEVFNGKVMHSMELYEMSHTELVELLKNKRVVIVGFLKTALDIADKCAKLNGN